MMCKKIHYRLFSFFCLLLLPLVLALSQVTLTSAADVTVAWDANTEPVLAGYKIYYKTGSPGPPYDGVGAAEGDSPIVIQLDPNGDGNTSDGDLSDPASPQFTIQGLSDTETIYSVVTAYGADDSESGYSNELSYDPSAPANQMPTASFATNATSGAAPLAVRFDGTGSSDPDGSIVSYSWAFGDSTTGSGDTTTHTYSSAGTYTVTLTVTDDQGGSGTATATITVTPPANQPPTATFATNATSGVAPLAVRFDGTGSSDPDGSIVSYSWAFGDSTTGSGDTTTHTYSSAGTYTVTLTVTDDQGGSGTATATITVTPPANQPPTATFATNATSGVAPLAVRFDGTGSSDPDGSIVSYSWAFGDSTTGSGDTTTHTYSSAGTYTVTLTVTDDQEATDNATTTIRVTTNSTGAQVTLAWDANTEPVLAGYKIYYKTGSPGPPYDGTGAAEGDSPIVIQLDPNGDGDTSDGDLSDPPSPEFTIQGLSDTETTYSVITAYDVDGNESGYSNELAFTPSPPVNQSPTASFTGDPTSGVAPLGVSFDGSGSSDPDGSIVSYSWAFGDSTAGSGDTASHTYGAQGTYVVTLTVTDDQGATASAASTITVTAADQPPDQPELTSPLDGDYHVSLTPELQAGTFSDPDGDAHAQSEWQMSDTSDFSWLVLDIASGSHLTSLTVPDSVLDGDTLYYWRIRFFDDYGGDSGWSAAYSFTTEDVSNEIGPDGIAYDQQVEPTVDVDNDGTFDVDQMLIDSTFKCVSSANGNVQIAVKGITNVVSIESLKHIDPVTIPDTVNRPADLPFGVISMRLTTVSPGDVAQVAVYFSDNLSRVMKWYKYDSVTGWEDYSQYVTVNDDGRSVTLLLLDGGHGDSDGVANGVIVDPGAIGISSTRGVGIAPAVYLLLLQ